MNFGDWGGGADFGSWGKRGRRRRRMFDSGELRLVLLKLIADEPRHGYDLIRAIEELTGGIYTPSPGVIYPTLNLLEDSGMIEGLRDDSARKAFSITEAGRAELAEKQEKVEAIFARLSGLGEESGARGSASVRRAMGNLFAVLSHRFSEKGIDDALIREVTDILDDAAQRIERL
jgi:DNA-binding PadR family transcriptional regulator